MQDVQPWQLHPTYPAGQLPVDVAAAQALLDRLWHTPAPPRGQSVEGKGGRHIQSHAEAKRSRKALQPEGGWRD
jgi:hypothetical protein